MKIASISCNEHRVEARTANALNKQQSLDQSTITFTCFCLILS